MEWMTLLKSHVTQSNSGSCGNVTEVMKQINERTNEQMNEQTYEQMNERMNK